MQGPGCSYKCQKTTMATTIVEDVAWRHFLKDHTDLRVYHLLAPIKGAPYHAMNWFSSWPHIVLVSNLAGIHLWRLTWNIIMEVWKIVFLSKWGICRFHVNLPGCIRYVQASDLHSILLPSCLYRDNARQCCRFLFHSASTKPQLPVNIILPPTSTEVENGSLQDEIPLQSGNHTNTWKHPHESEMKKHLHQPSNTSWLLGRGDLSGMFPYIWLLFAVNVGRHTSPMVAMDLLTKPSKKSQPPTHGSLY